MPPLFRKKTTEEEKEEEAKKTFEAGLASVKDLIAPSAFDIEYDYLRISERYCRVLFTYGYPGYIYTNWLSPIVNLPETLDISMFIYPVSSRVVLENLKKRVAQMQASMQIEAEKGQVRDPAMEAAYRDAEEMRNKLATGEERFFQFALYFTLWAETKEKLDDLTRRLETILGSRLIYTKTANLQMEQSFNSTLPIGQDELYITRNMDTSSLSTTFPFTSTELTQNEGILYGINRHNNTLVIFDRFSLENANSVVFAKAGAGKSYAIKLEALRSLMMGTEIIVIDPENEYQPLCDAVGGSFLSISLKSDKRINPFDLPKVFEEEEEQDALRANIITLSGLIKLMLGTLSPEEEAIIDKALFETYALKDITSDPKTWGNIPPTMEDLYNVLLNMAGAEGLANRLEKYVKGTFAGIFNQPTNIDLDKPFIVFSLRELEEQLRPIAMYIIADYIWNRVKSELKKRILIIDEAWFLMQHESSAQFLFSMAKRARKYYLGLTTITQDVEDFLDSKWGKAIVTNSSLQFLLKQSPAAIDLVASVFKLTQGEKYLLLECEVGDALFFAGLNHVAIHIVASYTEDQLITTSPKELLEIEAAKGELEVPPSEAPETIPEVPPKEETPSFAKSSEGRPTTPPAAEVHKVPEELGEIKPEETLGSPGEETPPMETPPLV